MNPLFVSRASIFRNAVLKEIMAVFDDKWLETKASITERGIFMFKNDLLSDVTLVVRASSDEGEPKKSKMAIPAHKCRR